MEMKIQDMVPEGTIVKEGDYIAQLDRSSYTNTLKDALDQLKTYQNNVDMKVLDTTVALTNLRDEIKNQRYVVEEASITLAQSKYEPPATIRQAEIALDKAQRTLNQKIKSYELKVAQNLSEINHEKRRLSQRTQLVTGSSGISGKIYNHCTCSRYDNLQKRVGRSKKENRIFVKPIRSRNCHTS